MEFVDAINRADVDDIFDLMTDDHIFVDSLGHEIKGNRQMKQAWSLYFKMFPDYKIEVEDILENDSIIVLLGYASATYQNNIDEINSNYWKIPASWKAITDGNKIRFWQVFADNSVAIEIINKNK